MSDAFSTLLHNLFDIDITADLLSRGLRSRHCSPLRYSPSSRD
jgi:hypothetical protein